MSQLSNLHNWHLKQNMCKHVYTCTSTHSPLLSLALAFSKNQFLVCTPMEVICIFIMLCKHMQKYARCMFIALELIKLWCSCSLRYLFTNGKSVCRDDGNTKTFLELSQELPSFISYFFTIQI